MTVLINLKRIRNLFLLALVLCFLSACTFIRQPFSVRADVDALATSEAQAKRRFIILPGDKQMEEQDLQFIEFKSYTETALLKQGFSKANSLEDGDVVLFLKYGVGEPQTQQYSYEVPIWSNFGFYPYSRRYRSYPMMPTYGIAGYTQHIETYTLYQRFIVLDAYGMTAYRQKQAPQQLWKIRVQSLGQSNDLRLMFPYLLAAMQPFLGSNTGHMLSVEIDELNPLVREIQLGSQRQFEAIVPQK